MNCYIVFLTCSLDDFPVRACATREEADQVAAEVNANPDFYLTVANKITRRGAKNLHSVCIATIRSGHFRGWELVYDLEGVTVG